MHLKTNQRSLPSKNSQNSQLWNILLRIYLQICIILHIVGNHSVLIVRDYPPSKSMPKVKKNTPLTTQVNSSAQFSKGAEVDSSKVEMIKNNELVNLISSKCRYLSQLMTMPSKIHESIMEQQWEEKINDRLLKYPHIPGAKLFNKISTECWNEIYLQKQENQMSFRDSEVDDKGLEEEIRTISAEVRQIEEKTGGNYSI